MEETAQAVDVSPVINPNANFWRNAILISGLLLIAGNLRPAVTSLAPLAERMRLDGVAVQIIGLQTTIPLVLFGAAGFFAGMVGARIGFARTLGAGLLILSSGCLLRSFGLADTSTDEIGGSILIGIGIAFGNVLLPGIVKSRFPNHVGLMTSFYSTAMNIGATIGIALAVPMAMSFSGGWNTSLRAWGFFALLPLLLWIPQMLQKPEVRTTGNPFKKVGSLLRDQRAWQVTAQMGLQSLLFYSSVAWLPTVLQDRGMSEAESFGWPTAMMLTGSIASLIIPTLAGRAPSQSSWTVGCTTTSLVGICGILWLPVEWAGWASLALGFGLNAGFGMSLLLIAMRSRTAESAGSLSSMAQAIGYLAAAPFPWLIGWLHTATDSWTAAYAFLLIPSLFLAVAGGLAGRAGFAADELSC